MLHYRGKSIMQLHVHRKEVVVKMTESVLFWFMADYPFGILQARIQDFTLGGWPHFLARGPHRSSAGPVGWLSPT